ncbi:etoposide-induced protein 2.4-domain-containing protein [Mycotypha africana]|uniref:etoposide-induced protein 2.4-domain-containing protein n=1 Tax=Mycotypha africana TaxID=64632 RepID=UPI0023007848|nr:etoposide-induced protein 2.4-domain-containing protein [Mycotypha africana]KAI8971902.1 etoposide-induced protein 2.4-domain-containing protein [Mycotypha africana]
MTPLQQDAAATRDSSASLSSTISTIILYANFVLYINLLRRVPLIGSTVSFLNYCIIMAYYCFEYTWINQDWSIEQRMTYAEEHWAYCLGFGLPASALTFFLSTLRSNGVFALLFPSYIMMASVGVPEPASSLLKKEIPFVANPSALPHKIPVFLGVRLLNQFIIRFIGILFGSRGVGSKNRYNSFDSDRSKINLNKIV